MLYLLCICLTLFCFQDGDDKRGLLEKITAHVDICKCNPCRCDPSRGNECSCNAVDDGALSTCHTSDAASTKTHVSESAQTQMPESLSEISDKLSQVTEVSGDVYSNPSLDPLNVSSFSGQIADTSLSSNVLQGKSEAQSLETVQSMDHAHQQISVDEFLQETVEMDSSVSCNTVSASQRSTQQNLEALLPPSQPNSSSFTSFANLDDMSNVASPSMSDLMSYPLSHSIFGNGKCGENGINPAVGLGNDSTSIEQAFDVMSASDISTDFPFSSPNMIEALLTDDMGSLSNLPSNPQSSSNNLSRSFTPQPMSSVVGSSSVNLLGQMPQHHIQTSSSSSENEVIQNDRKTLSSSVNCGDLRSNPPETTSEYPRQFSQGKTCYSGSNTLSSDFSSLSSPSGTLCCKQNKNETRSWCDSTRDLVASMACPNSLKQKSCCTGPQSPLASLNTNCSQNSPLTPNLVQAPHCCSSGSHKSVHQPCQSISQSSCSQTSSKYPSTLANHSDVCTHHQSDPQLPQLDIHTHQDSNLKFDESSLSRNIAHHHLSTETDSVFEGGKTTFPDLTPDPKNFHRKIDSHHWHQSQGSNIVQQQHTDLKDQSQSKADFHCHHSEGDSDQHNMMLNNCGSDDGRSSSATGRDLAAKKDEDSCCVVICTNKLQMLRNVLAKCECTDQEGSSGPVDLQTLLNDALMEWESSEPARGTPTFSGNPPNSPNSAFVRNLVSPSGGMTFGETSPVQSNPSFVVLQNSSNTQSPDGALHWS